MRRLNPSTTRRRLRLWPRKGLKAWLALTMRGLARHAATPHQVALGAALGMWVNFMPVPGLGALVAIFAAWALRANIPAAFLAQALGNPWTFAPIWWLCYKTGKAMLGIDYDTASFRHLMSNLTMSYFHEHALTLMHGVLWPMLVGGQVWGIGLGLLTYAGVSWEMQRLAQRKAKRRV